MATKKLTEFRIINRRTGKALQSTGLENGCAVQQAEISSCDAQIWYTAEAEGGVKIFNKAAGKVLDVKYGSTDKGYTAQIWDDVDGASQLWTVVTVSSTYKKLVQNASSMVLDIAYLSTEDGAPAQLWEDLSGDNQQWKLQAADAEKKPAKKTASKKPAEKAEKAAKKPAAKKKAAEKK